MEGESSARCPVCSRWAGVGAAFCPHCGTRLNAADGPAAGPAGPTTHWSDRERPRRGTVHGLLKLACAIWLVAYPVISCGAIVMGAGAGGTGGGLLALGGLIAGAVLFWPWVAGLVVLGFLALLIR